MIKRKQNLYPCNLSLFDINLKMLEDKIEKLGEKINKSIENIKKLEIEMEKVLNKSIISLDPIPNDIDDFDNAQMTRAYADSWILDSIG